MPNPSPSDWRDLGNETSKPEGKRPWQGGEPAETVAAAAPSKIKFKRTLALVALFVISIAIGAVIILLRPGKPACLVLVGSGYESNLLVPHNSYGSAGLAQLETSVAEEDPLVGFWWKQPTKMRRTGKGIDFTGKNWRSAWDELKLHNSKEKTVVLFISSPGIADKDDTGKDEAYFLSNAADVSSPKTYKESRVPFGDFLDALKTLPKKNVVVFVDAAFTQAHWPIGMLHNDFARVLESKYRGVIESMGNVIVICSADADQLAWNSEEWQTSVFTHYVTEGLKGAAAKSSSEHITAKKLFDYVAPKVDLWAKANRARRQTPIMLGKDDLAERIELIFISDPYVEQDSKDAPGLNFDTKSLADAWEKWRALKSTSPHVPAPHWWRQYQETLLRYEQLVRAGDPTGKARDQLKRLDEMEAEIRNGSTLEKARACSGNSLPMHLVLGVAPKQDHLDQLFFNLQKKDAGEETKKLLDAVRDQPRALVRTELGRRLLADLLQQNRFNRADAFAWLAAIDEKLPGTQRAAEVHLLKMLQDAHPALDSDTIKLGLRVRVLAEQTALSAFMSDRTTASAALYSEAISPWLQGDVEKADSIRREGEDLLFGDPKTHGVAAAKKLDEAQKLYVQIGRDARYLQSILNLRDSILSDLPYLASWLASSPPAAKPGRDRPELERSLVDAMAIFARLSRKLALDPNVPGDRKLLAAFLRSDDLKDDIARVADSIQSVRDEYKQTCKDLAEGPTDFQTNWHAMNAALAIPPMSVDDVSTRLEILAKLRKISAKFHLNPNPESAAADQPARTAQIKRQSEFLRASLKPFDKINEPQPASIDAGVAEFYLSAPQAILEKSSGLMGAEPDLREAGNLCRVIPGALAIHVKTEEGKRVNPVERLRRQRLHGLFCWLADRTWADHWFEPRAKNPRIETYYIPSAQSYLASAKGLFDKYDKEFISDTLLARTRDLQDRLTLTKFDVPESPKLYWTTELRFPVRFEVSADKRMPPGKMMYWHEKKAGADAIAPRHAVPDWPVGKQFVDTIRLESKDLAGGQDAPVTFHAYYRGLHLARTPTIAHMDPKVIVHRYPAPLKGALAVRVDPNFDYGAICVVLDTSGSMQWIPQMNGVFPNAVNKKSRLEYATDALKFVLKKTPDDTFMSIVTFDPEDGAGDNGGLFLQEPVRWFGKNYDQMEARLAGVKAKGGSPIAKVLIDKMRTGFPRGYAGPRAIIVLTDGKDEGSYNANDPAKNTREVVERLRQANKDLAGVDVYIVCFIANDTDFKDAEQQFAEIREFRPRKGRLERLTDGEKLGENINDLLRPRLQLLKLKDREPIDEFRNGHRVSYGRGEPLNWTSRIVNSGRYFTHIARNGFIEKDILFYQGQKQFMVLKNRAGQTYLERAILANQAESIKGGCESKEQDGWVASLLENTNLRLGAVKQLLTWEKLDVSKNPIRQPFPAFQWLELKMDDGRLPPKVVTWGNDWNVPAAAFRVRTDEWPANARPKLTSWFFPDDEELLQREKKMLFHTAEMVVPSEDPVNASGFPDGPVIDSMTWENLDLISPKGDGPKTRCLAVRVRHAKGRPVWLELNQATVSIGSVHHYFPGADSCTAYFYGISDLPRASFRFIDIEAFKDAARRNARQVEFSTDREIRVPPFFSSGE